MAMGNFKGGLLLRFFAALYFYSVNFEIVSRVGSATYNFSTQSRPARFSQVG